MMRLFKLFGALLLLVVTPVMAEAPPKVIRIAAIGSYGHSLATSYMGVMQAKRFAEQEFAPDGTQIQWLVTDGAGPAQNEALANGLADFANYGGLPNIIGRARGLKTRILASYGYTNTYVVARSDLPIRTLADLRGRTIGVDVGHIPHLVLSRLLEQAGIGAGGAKLVAMKNADSIAALAAKRIDATIGPSLLFSLVDQGKGRIIFTSKGKREDADYFGAFLVTDDFAHRYPETTTRIVKAYLQAVRWASDPANRERFLSFSARASNTPLAYVRRDFEGETVKDKADPLPDGAYVARYRAAAAFSLQNRLIRQPVSVDNWVDARFIVAALRQLRLWGYWKPH